MKRNTVACWAVLLWLSPDAWGQSERSACIEAAELGQTERRAGRLLPAEASFARCLAAGCPASIRKDCTQWEAEVRSLIPVVKVSVVDGQGQPLVAELSVDGAAFAGTAMRVEGGPHRVLARAPGFLVAERAVDAPLGTTQTIQLVLLPVPSPKRGLRAAAWVTLGLGAASLVAGSALGLVTRGQYEALRTGCAPGCSPAEVQPVRSLGLAADLSFLGALVFGGTSTALFITSVPPSEQE